MLIMFIAPLFVLVLAIFIEYAGIDLILIQPFYDFSANMWPYKSYWFTQKVLHDGGRNLVIFIDIIFFLLLMCSLFYNKLKPYRRGFVYLLITGLLGPSLAALGKHTTHIYSPYDLTLFGGTEPYIRIFDSVPEGAKIGKAFPAGHSSGAFAFLSLYFFALKYRPLLRYHGLFFALILGSIFGVTQQIRGAHFLSHDLFSLVICWYNALITYCLILKN